MDKVFHFHVIQYLCLAANIPKEYAHTIAYASQFVDDNVQQFEVRNSNNGIYQNYISQTYDIRKPQKTLMRIYPCFHFVPGDSDVSTARRSDGMRHLLITTPDSRVARKMLDLAFVSDNPMRIGIALHAYADTWAHQNFVGYYSPINSLEGVFKKLTPNIGHADALTHPDTFSLDTNPNEWHDIRLTSSNRTVCNKGRFRRAAEAIYQRLLLYNKAEEAQPFSNVWEGILCELPKIIMYDEDLWFREAIEKRGFLFWKKYYWKKDKEQTKWFQFQEAVKEHQKVMLNLLKPIFDEMELQEF